MCDVLCRYPYGRNHSEANDTHYDLALFKWGLNTLLELDKELGMNDSLAKTWTHTRDNLVNLNKLF